MGRGPPGASSGGANNACLDTRKSAKETVASSDNCVLAFAGLNLRHRVNTDVGALSGLRTESDSDPIKTNVRADPVATAPGSDTTWAVAKAYAHLI